MDTGSFTAIKSFFSGGDKEEDMKKQVDPFIIAKFAGKRVKSSVKYTSNEPIFNEQLQLKFNFPSMCKKLKLDLRDWWDFCAISSKVMVLWDFCVISSKIMVFDTLLDKASMRIWYFWVFIIAYWNIKKPPWYSFDKKWKADAVELRLNREVEFTSQ